MMKNRSFAAGIALLILMAFSAVSCSKDDPVSKFPEDRPYFKSFGFYKEDNSTLTGDVKIDMADYTAASNVIDVFEPRMNTSALVARFDGKFVSVTVGGKEQVSKETRNDFNESVVYTLTDENGATTQYEFHVKGYNGLPIVSILTEGYQAVSSKEDYVPCTVEITNDPANGKVSWPAQIRGRGNATWNYQKKPYKLKLDAKQPVFGFPSNKNWVLLADYCDKSFLRTAYMAEVSNAVGMDYTIKYQHIDFKLNKDPKGTYILTEQVKDGKNRVNVGDDGFIIEDDNYYTGESLWFTTERCGFNYTFKYPDADDGEIVKGDDNFQFITEFMKNVEDALVKIPEDCETYRQYIDINSFAKWYIATEVTGNWEPNLYYVLASRTDKLKFFPCWDAEWSLGLACKGNSANPNGWWGRPHESPYDIDIWGGDWNGNKYFRYLFQDPAFVEEVRTEWKAFKEMVPAVKTRIRNVAESIKYSQKDNFDRWEILGSYLAVSLVRFNTWEEEVAYANTFFDNKVKWMDEKYGK